MKEAAKITFAQSKRFLLEHNLTVREKNSLEQAAFLHEVKVVCCLPTPFLHYQALHAKQPQRKLVSGFSFTCSKYPPQSTDDKSNDNDSSTDDESNDSSMREGSA